MCPTHVLPQTYGEVSRKVVERDEAERQRLMRENGRPESSGVLTCAMLDWNFETATGRRCWYCGKRK